MANINDNELEYLNKFLEKFNPAVGRVLSQNLDKEIFKKYEFITNSIESIRDVNSLKENNALYELDYVRGEDAGTFVVLIPEELIASITDVVMGGSGEGAYKDSLSEIEVNAFSELLPKIFKEIEKIYVKFYEQNLAFDADPLFLTKSNAQDYSDKFKNMGYDYVVNYTLKINKEKDYKLHLLLKTNDLKQVLQQLKGVLDGGLDKKAVVESITLEHLTEIKIDIAAELGRAKVPIKYALELVPGSMVELDTLNGEDIRVFANGIEVAKAQIVVIEDTFGLRITKIVAPEERMKYI